MGSINPIIPLLASPFLLCGPNVLYLGPPKHTNQTAMVDSIRLPKGMPVESTGGEI
jgi:hypothetical protein